MSPSQQGGSSPSVLDRGLDVKSPGVDLDEFSKPCEPNGTTETGSTRDNCTTTVQIVQIVQMAQNCVHVELEARRVM